MRDRRHSPPFEPWDELYQRYKAHPLLGRPLDVLHAHLDPEAVEALDVLAQETGIARIAELLIDGPRHFYELDIDRAIIPAVVRAVRALADAAVPPPIPAIPDTLEGLRAWAAEHQLTPLLTSPRVMGGGRTLEDLWSVPPDIHRKFLAESLTHAARLVAIALPEEAQRAAARRARPPADPVARALVEALEQLRDELRRHVPPLPRDYRPHVAVGYLTQAVETYAVIHAPSLVGELTVHAKATLALAAAPALSGSCTCGVRCSHQLLLIDALLDELHGPRPSDGLPRLLDRLRVPAWQRLVADLDALTPTPDAQKSKPLAWLFTTQGGVMRGSPLQLSAHEERVTKGGVRALGPSIAFDTLMRRRVAADLPADHDVLELMAAEREMLKSSYLSTSRAWTPRTVRQAALALVGHPRVWVTDLRHKDALPLAVRGAALQVRAVEVADGVRLEPHIDGTPVNEQRFLAEVESGVWLTFDRARGVAHVARIGREARVLAETLAATPAVIPSDARGEILRRIPRIEAHLPVVRSAALRGEAVAPQSAVVVRLEPRFEEPRPGGQNPGGGLAVALQVRPVEGGPRLAPGEGPVTVHGSRADGTLLTTERALDAERAAAQALLVQVPALAALDLLAGDPPRLVHGEDAIALVAALQAEGDAVTVEWPKPDDRWFLRRTLGSTDLRLEVVNRDWFGIAGGVDVGDERLRLEALLDAVRQERRFVRLRGNDWVAVDASLKATLSELDQVLREGRSGLEIGPAGPVLLADLAQRIGVFDTTERWRELESRITEAATLEPEVPASLAPILRPYQQDGFRWMMRLASWGAGACLADDMGLGKTIQALAVLVARASRGPALVVAPTSVGFNWVREAARFAPQLRTILLREMRPEERAAALATLGPGDVVIVGYGLLTREIERLTGQRFASLVLDEAQALKNASTDRAQAAQRIDAEWHLALTGTPIENHLGELWSLFRVISPGLFGSLEAFRRRYGAGAPVAGLSRQIRPFVLRRTKAEVAVELPAKTEAQVDVALSAAERRLYERARLAAVAHLTGALDDLPPEQRRFQVLAAITRLRQLACHPRLVDAESPVPSSKLRRLVELLEELRAEGHRALVFSQFTTHLALVREALDAAQIGYAYLDGQTPAAQRAARVDAFQLGEVPVFLLSLKAGGTGLNLTGADYVIHLDPWWNPAVEDQASDRAHRIGQTRPVTVLRLVASGTIEEAILALHADKRALVSQVLDGTGAAGAITTEELVALVRDARSAEEGEDEAPLESAAMASRPASAPLTVRGAITGAEAPATRGPEPTAEPPAAPSRVRGRVAARRTSATASAPEPARTSSTAKPRSTEPPREARAPAPKHHRATEPTLGPRAIPPTSPPPLVLPATLGSTADGLRALAREFAAFSRAELGARSSSDVVKQQAAIIDAFVTALIEHGPGRLHARSSPRDCLAVYQRARTADRASTVDARRSTLVLRRFLEFASLAVEEG